MKRVLYVVWFERLHLLRMSRLLICLLACIVAACYIVQAFAVTALESYAKDVDKHSNLSTIELNTLRPDSAILDSDALVSLEHLEHVVEVSPWIQHDLDLPNAKDWPSPDNNPGALWATTYFEPRLPPLVKGERKQHLDDGEIVLPVSVPGGDLTHLYGATVEFGYSHVDGKFQGSYRTTPLKVVGLYDNSIPDKDGPTASYVSLSTMQHLFGGTLPATYSFAYVHVDSAQNSADVQRQLAQRGFSVTGAAGAQDAVGLVGTLIAISTYTLPLIMVSALICGVFLSRIWLKQRHQDFALLRCLGYTPRQVSSVAFLQALCINLVASIAGVILGCLAVLALVRAFLPPNIPQYELFSGALFDPSVAAQVIGVSTAGVILGTLPFLAYLARVSPDTLLRG